MISWLVAIIVLFVLGHHHAVANLLLFEAAFAYLIAKINPAALEAGQKQLWITIAACLLLAVVSYNV